MQIKTNLVIRNKDISCVKKSNISKKKKNFSFLCIFSLDHATYFALFWRKKNLMQYTAILSHIITLFCYLLLYEYILKNNFIWNDLFCLFNESTCFSSSIIATHNGCFHGNGKQLKILRQRCQHLEACLCSNYSKDKNVSRDGLLKQSRKRLMWSWRLHGKYFIFLKFN